MRDDRERQPRADSSADPALIVVRGSAGIGKTDLVRRWAGTLSGAALLWPSITPPRSTRNFWMRAITQLHARGWISDQALFDAIDRAGQPDDDIRDIVGGLLHSIADSPIIVLDDLHSAVDDGMYLEIVSDLVHFLRACEKTRAVIIESSPSPIDAIDLPDHIVVSEAHLPPVAFLGRVSGSGVGFLSSAPGLRALVQDSRLLRDVCIAAMPHEIDAEVAGTLTGRDGAELLETFARWGLGTLESEPHKSRFVFRADTRIAALAELRRSWPELLVTTAERLSRLYMMRAEYDVAFEFAVLTGDVALITRVGLRMVPFPMELTPDIVDAIGRLPLEDIHNSAMLSLFAATVAEQAPRPDRSTTDLYRHAADAARASSRGLRPTERLVMLGIESYALQHAGNMSAAITAALHFAERAAAMITEHDIDAELAHVFGNFAYQVAVTLITGDEFTAAAALLTHLERYCLAHGIEYRRRFALAGLAFLESVGGRVPASLTLTQTTEGPLTSPLQSSRSYGAFVNATAVICAGLTGDFDALQRAVTTLREHPHPMHWDVLLFGEVILDLATGNVGAARVRFDEAVGAHLAFSPSAPSPRRASYVRSILVLFGENPRLLATSGTRTTEDPLSLAFSAGRDIDHGDQDAAAAKLGKAAASAHTPLQQHVVFTMLARLGVASEDPETTRDAASHLLVLARTHKLRLAFALLTRDERTRILQSLRSPGELRAAFAVTRPLAQESTAVNASILTARQLVIIRALADLGSRQEVARKLFLSPGTVKAHLRAIYKKLDAHNQAEAIYKAAALGLLRGR